MLDRDFRMSHGYIEDSWYVSGGGSGCRGSLTWNFKLSLSLQEVGICYDELLSLLSSPVSNRFRKSNPISMIASRPIQDVMGSLVATRAFASQCALGMGRVELTSTSRTVTPPPMIAVLNLTSATD